MDSRVNARGDNALDLDSPPRMRVLIIAITVIRRDAPSVARSRGRLILPWLARSPKARSARRDDTLRRPHQAWLKGREQVAVGRVEARCDRASSVRGIVLSHDDLARGTQWLHRDGPPWLPQGDETRCGSQRRLAEATVTAVRSPRPPTATPVVACHLGVIWEIASQRSSNGGHEAARQTRQADHDPGCPSGCACDYKSLETSAHCRVSTSSVGA